MASVAVAVGGYELSSAAVNIVVVVVVVVFVVFVVELAAIGTSKAKERGEEEKKCVS